MMVRTFLLLVVVSLLLSAIGAMVVLLASGNSEVAFGALVGYLVGTLGCSVLYILVEANRDTED